MEMHQVRYFLTVAKHLNFSRAADECNVTQPSLSRAIKQLEAEIGGELFVRGPPSARLTPLGHAVHPALKQCYEAALGAQSLAISLKRRAQTSLRLAVAESIDLAPVLPHIQRVRNRFEHLDLTVQRGDAAKTAAMLRDGDVELVIAVNLHEAGASLHQLPLFTEGFDLVVPAQHRLAGQPLVPARELRREPLLIGAYCEHTQDILDELSSLGVAAPRAGEVHAERDLLGLVAAGLGIALLPRSAPLPMGLQRIPVAGLAIERTVSLYSVAGRPWSRIGASIINQFRRLRPDRAQLDAAGENP
ncbi:LysR family transcriptional regulator [Bradyrhizobium sp. STM 3809]|uniref:LysR family transcriptional regulator n=1 Tax=Bradyrhizobium sp. STM 3809 TaxID=551936 RepID=UPI000240ADB0|nr:LysR family transcriptional regulator [Bradyrhizobium sp. STM 3809]CCD99262.1 putative transcriptional regulatory protein, LysR family [Bradyrhizobium sp. STM 3809]